MIGFKHLKINLFAYSPTRKLANLPTLGVAACHKPQPATSQITPGTVCTPPGIQKLHRARGIAPVFHPEGIAGCR